jgi:hypothetical protein
MPFCCKPNIRSAVMSSRSQLLWQRPMSERMTRYSGWDSDELVTGASNASLLLSNKNMDRALSDDVQHVSDAQVAVGVIDELTQGDDKLLGFSIHGDLDEVALARHGYAFFLEDHASLDVGIFPKRVLCIVGKRDVTL